MNDVANDRPEAVQTTAPEARLAAALRKANRLGFAELRMDNGDRMVPADIDHYARTYLLAADPTLAADLALAAAARHVVAQDYEKRPDLFWAALDMLDKAAKEAERE